MQLLDHVSLSVSNLAECAAFYDAIMASLGCEKVYGTETSLGYGVRCTAGEEAHSCIAIYQSESANLDNSRHWCFKAQSQEAVIEFYDSGVAAGGQCNGKPGLREHYHANYFGAFLLDPFGNRVEAVFHGIKT
jgi:catechol 2,3-dioxygenase-like lactoylglutathione lyase family enzyme